MYYLHFLTDVETEKRKFTLVAISSGIDSCVELVRLFNSLYERAKEVVSVADNLSHRKTGWVF